MSHPVVYSRRAVSGLASIYGLRMLGLFMVLPVLSLWAGELKGSTPFLIGIAIGIYGLTQAVLQIPFGLLSDRVGRKRMITIGLIIFFMGSLLAAVADSIGLLILGRAIQGSGAVAAVVMALTADLTPEESRMKAMAFIGMSIGMAFALAMVIGPVFAHAFGVPALFWITAGLTVLALVVLHRVVPNPVESRFRRDVSVAPSQLKEVFANTSLMQMNLSVLLLHMMLTATFVVLPMSLRDMGLGGDVLGWFYAPVMVLALIGMVPLVIIAEKKRQIIPVFRFCILGLGIAQLLFLKVDSVWLIGGVLFLFFLLFNVMEATMPSMVAKLAPADRKGTAMGMFTTSQFFGAFLGGVLAGWCYQNWGYHSVYLMSAAMAIVWMLLASRFKKISYLANRMLSVDETLLARGDEINACLRAIPGVHEVLIHPEDKVIYLKVDSRELDGERLENWQNDLDKAASQQPKKEQP